MNSKLKLSALMTAMMVMSPPMPYMESERIAKKDISHLRKKCKSCKQFKGKYCLIKPYRSPMDQACDKYEHK
jgi:hypothetical protein